MGITLSYLLRSRRRESISSQTASAAKQRTPADNVPMIIPLPQAYVVPADWSANTVRIDPAMARRIPSQSILLNRAFVPCVPDLGFIGGRNQQRKTKIKGIAGTLRQSLVLIVSGISAMNILRSCPFESYFSRNTHLQSPLFAIAPPKVGPRIDAEVKTATIAPRTIVTRSNDTSSMGIVIAMA